MCHLKHCSVRPKVKVGLEGQIFVVTITLTILDGFQYKFALLFSIMSRFAISNICSGRPKFKVTLAGHVVPGQPPSLDKVENVWSPAFSPFPLMFLRGFVLSIVESKDC